MNVLLASYHVFQEGSIQPSFATIRSTVTVAVAALSAHGDLRPVVPSLFLVRPDSIEDLQRLIKHSYCLQSCLFLSSQPTPSTVSRYPTCTNNNPRRTWDRRRTLFTSLHIRNKAGYYHWLVHLPIIYTLSTSVNPG